MKLSMDNPIVTLKCATDKIMKGLNELSYEELEQFIEDREKLINMLPDFLKTHSITVEDKNDLEYILSYDSALQDRMNHLKTEAANWLAQRSIAKSQRSAYDSKYSSDSVLMDKRE